MAMSPIKRRLAWIGAPVLLILVLVAFWDWDWLIPVVQSRASAALGRPVTIEHLHVRLGRLTEISTGGVLIANPPDWKTTDAPFATVRTLTIQADAWGYLLGNGLVLPTIGIDGLKVFAAETAEGLTNFQLSPAGDLGGSTAIKIGDVRIADSDARVLLPRLKADFTMQIATRGEGNASSIVVDAKGTYAAQPITGHLVGGALLSLRDAGDPWPIELTVANGPTHLALNGTLSDPLAFRGANVRFRLDGPDMSQLERLAGFPIPKTPPYQIGGKLDLQGFQAIRFEDVQGRVGNSDIAGTIEEHLNAAEGKRGSKPVVTMDLRSKRVDLADLSGFIGGTPGPPAANAKPDANARFLPNTPISVPRLDWADIHLRYHGAHIEGRNMPLDDLTIALDVVGGDLDLAKETIDLKLNPSLAPFSHLP